MSFDELGTAIVNTEFLLDKQLGALSAGGAVDGESILQVTQGYRRLACGELLMDLDVEAFRDNLCQSAKTYVELLEACQRKDADPYYHWRSHGLPLLDAVAAGASELAASIAKLSANTCFAEQGESEDEHWFFRLIAALATQASADELEAMLAAFRAALEGDASSRHDVVAALVARDAAEFAPAFADLLEDWQMEMDSLREEERLEPYDAATVAHICIEGLALLRLAQQRGIPIEPEYPHIPRQVLA
jgi:glycine cleavage system regulatory protein